ncbi:hypothetical protein [Amycolatopsis sp. WAC 01375]|uniref:hypothetical protein n=1 Tax=Amycolatopsis sp. WAC 01375 TaxID=2203194 RepID=UPI000F7AF46F|nr:hypothetical protein [Amycolatopsis sp. WAC 01375]
MVRRALVCFLRFVLVLSLTAGVVAALPVATAVAAGSGGVDKPLNSVPDQPDVDPAKVSVPSEETPKLPAAGSAARKSVDDALAARDEATARVRQKLTPVRVEGAAALPVEVKAAQRQAAAPSCGDGGPPL